MDPGLVDLEITENIAMCRTKRDEHTQRPSSQIPEGISKLAEGMVDDIAVTTNHHGQVTKHRHIAY